MLYIFFLLEVYLFKEKLLKLKYFKVICNIRNIYILLGVRYKLSVINNAQSKRKNVVSDEDIINALEDTDSDIVVDDDSIEDPPRRYFFLMTKRNNVGIF